MFETIRNTAFDTPRFPTTQLIASEACRPGGKAGVAVGVIVGVAAVGLAIGAGVALSRITFLSDSSWMQA